MLTRSELSIRSPQWCDCPIIFRWRDQLEVGFAHVNAPSMMLHCPNTNRNTDSCGVNSGHVYCVVRRWLESLLRGAIAANHAFPHSHGLPDAGDDGSAGQA